MEAGYVISEVRGVSRILIVDDERPVREMLARWLRTAGYRCECAADTNEAAAVLESGSVDLVITDLRMPGQSGLDFIVQLQRERPNTAVLMLTACEDPRFGMQAMTYGAEGYLIKPVEMRDLLHQVGKVLKRRRALLDATHRSTSLEQLVNDQTRLVRLAHEEVIHRLVAASMVRDDETGAHIKRIGLFSAAVAEAAGWSTETVDNIRLAAPMHDIGKIGIPDAILLKPGKLTAEEFEIMKTHALIGASILKNSHSAMMQMAEQIARSHHEWWNGNGYPDGLLGEAIPPAARIVAIVDVYDALTHDRIYRPALPESETIAILEQGRATHFDPVILDTFLGALPVIRELAREDLDNELADQGNGTVQAVLAFKQSPVFDRPASAKNAELETVFGEKAATNPHRSSPGLVLAAAETPACVSGPLSRFVFDSRNKSLASR
jgi:putative two-component system response regulator